MKVSNKFLKLATKLTKPVDMIHWHKPTAEHPDGYCYNAPSTISPVFIAAVAQYARLSALLPANHPLCHAATIIVIQTVPLERQGELLPIAIELGLIPIPTVYDSESGMGVYQMEKWGREAGLTDEEMSVAFDEIMRMRTAAGLKECILPYDAELLMMQ